MTKAQQPAYPSSAGALNVSYASAVIKITVDPSAKVTGATIYKSSGNQAIDQATIAAAFQSSYAPKLVDCRPVAGDYLFRGDFQNGDLILTDSTNPPDDAEIPHAGSAWENPFCDASAVVVPWNRTKNIAWTIPTDTYALYVWANATSDYAARVTFVGGGSAYAVDVPRVVIPKGMDPRSHRFAYLVSFPKATEVDEYFVDGVGVDGSPVGNCPSFVKVVRSTLVWNDTPVPAAQNFGHLDARFLQALPPASCAAPYTALAMTKPSPAYLDRGYKERPSAEIEAFVDSAGHVIKAKIWRSSGIADIDDAAKTAVEDSSYEPAHFLCTPVVSNGIFTETYKP